MEEFIAGCCRIHGPAKAIDLTTLMCQAADVIGFLELHVRCGSFIWSSESMRSGWWSV